MFLNQIRLLVQLFDDLFCFNKVRASLTCCLMFLKSMTSGIGLFLILPLLQCIGFSIGAQTAHPITQSVSQWMQFFFEMMHCPMHLVSMLCVYIGMMTLLALLAYFEQVSGSVLQQNYIRHLRAEMHQKLLSTPWPFFLKRKVSDILYALTTQIQSIALCNHQLLGLLNHLLLIVVYTGLACMLSFKMTLLAVCCALFLLGLMRPLHRLTSRAGATHLKQNQAIFQTISEQFQALKMIKGSGLETQFMKELLTVNAALMHENQQMIVMTAKSKLFYSCGGVVLFSVLLYVALTQFAVPLEALFVLLVIFSRLLPMVSSGQQMYQRILHQLPAYEAIQALKKACIVEALEEQAVAAPIVFESCIEFKSVSFCYPEKPEVMVIYDMSFRIEKNTTTVLVGPSGAGKSTLADLIAGLMVPTMGDIWIDNQLLQPQNNIAWRRQVAYVTQEVFLFNASIRDNLTWFHKQYTDADLWKVIDMSAADFVYDLEAGLETIVGDRGVRLSGGERQRIALARALLMKPALLILDESTNALDAENIKNIQKALRALDGKMTIILISHQPMMHLYAKKQIKLTRNVQGLKGHAKQQKKILDADKAPAL